jgi:hypothetical protein
MVSKMDPYSRILGFLDRYRDTALLQIRELLNEWHGQGRSRRCGLLEWSGTVLRSTVGNWHTGHTLLRTNSLVNDCTSTTDIICSMTSEVLCASVLVKCFVRVF